MDGLKNKVKYRTDVQMFKKNCIFVFYSMTDRLTDQLNSLRQGVTPPKEISSLSLIAAKKITLRAE